MRAGSLALLCVLFASLAEGAPLSRLHRSPNAHKAAGPRAMTVRVVMRRLKTLTARVLRTQRARAYLQFDFRPHLQRTERTRAAVDHDIIQNDGPMSARYEDPHIFVLRSAGTVVDLSDRGCAPRACSPQSPRAPPSAA